jgi:hypothetical protein
MKNTDSNGFERLLQFYRRRIESSLTSNSTGSKIRGRKHGKLEAMASHLDNPVFLTIIPYLVYLWTLFCHTFPINRVRGPITSNLLLGYLRWVTKVWCIATSGYLGICLVFALLTASTPSSRLSQILSGLTECTRRSNINKCNSHQYVCSMLRKECWALAMCLSQSNQHTIISEILLEWIHQFWSGYYSFIPLVSLYIFIIARFTGNVAACGWEFGGRTCVPHGPDFPDAEAIEQAVGNDLHVPPTPPTPPPRRRVRITHRQDRLRIQARFARQDATLNENVDIARPQDPAQAQALRNAGFRAIRPPGFVHNDLNPNPEGRLRAAAYERDHFRLLDEADRAFHIFTIGGIAATPNHLVEQGLVETQDPPFHPLEVDEARDPGAGVPIAGEGRQALLLSRSGHAESAVDPDQPRHPIYAWDAIGLLVPDPTPEHPDAFVDRAGRRYNIVVRRTGATVPLARAREILEIFDEDEQGGEDAEGGGNQEDREYEIDNEAVADDGNPNEGGLSPREIEDSTASGPIFGEELTHQMAPIPVPRRPPPMTAELLQQYRLNLVAHEPPVPEFNRPVGSIERPAGDAHPEPGDYWADSRGARFRITQLRGDDVHFLSHNEVTRILNGPPPGEQPVGSPHFEIGPATRAWFQTPAAQAHFLVQNDMHPVPFEESAEGGRIETLRPRFPQGDLVAYDEAGFAAQRLAAFVMRDETYITFLVVDHVGYAVDPEEVQTVQDLYKLWRQRAFDALPFVDNFITHNNLFSTTYPDLQPARPQMPQGELRLEQGPPTHLLDDNRTRYLVYRRNGVQDMVQPHEVLRLQDEFLLRQLQLRRIDAIPYVNNFLTSNHLFSVAHPDPPLRAGPQMPHGDLRLIGEDSTHLQDETGTRYQVFRRQNYEPTARELSLVPNDEVLQLQNEFLQVHQRARQDIEPENREQDNGPGTESDREYPASAPANRDGESGSMDGQEYARIL